MEGGKTETLSINVKNQSLEKYILTAKQQKYSTELRHSTKSESTESRHHCINSRLLARLKLNIVVGPPALLSNLIDNSCPGRCMTGVVHCAHRSDHHRPN